MFEMSRIRRQINRIVRKISLKQPIVREDIDPLIRPLNKLAEKIMQRKDYYQVKSFCGGLAETFSGADKIERSKIFNKTVIPIKGIIKISSVFLSKKINELEEEYGDINTIKVNIRDLLNQLNASLKAVVIPQLRKAAA